ncbi:VOC family protein [bacterium]|jgi:catechol 2,3-dioxygenase-like lactoylglutathione lyase family enzyme|nr:VOC family protein [bacterium]
MRIQNFRHTGIVVTDMIRSLQFYRDLLGFKIQIDRVESGEYISLLLALPKGRVHIVKLSSPDGVLIELLQFLSHPEESSFPGVTPIGCSHIALSVSNIDEIYEEYREKGVTFLSVPVVSPDNFAKVVYCRDPDGSFVELVQEL